MVRRSPPSTLDTSAAASARTADRPRIDRLPHLVPSTSKGRRSRAALIDATIDVVGEYGFAAARVEEISRRAGFGYGTFYKYFSSKLDVMRDVIERVYDDIFQAAYPQLDDFDDPREYYRVGLEGFNTAAEKYERILRAIDEVVGLDATLLQLRDGYLYRGVEHTHGVILQLIEQGWQPVGDPYLLAHAVNSLTVEMGRRFRAYEPDISRTEFVKFVVSVWGSLILGEREPAEGTHASGVLQNG